MPLKPGSTESAQPSKIVDETSAAPTQEADPSPAMGGAQFDQGTDSPPVRQPASQQSVAVATNGGTVDKNFGSLDGKLGFGAFPQVKLDKDKFVVGEEGELDEFDFRAIGSQSRWIYKRNDDVFFFSYDQVTATNGRAVNDIIADWKSEGDNVKEKREYQEVAGYILDGEFADRMVTLSIPPASVPRLAGVRAEQEAMFGRSLGDIVMHVQKGAKITTAQKKTFYPWKFSFLCLSAPGAYERHIAERDAAASEEK